MALHGIAVVHRLAVNAHAAYLFQRAVHGHVRVKLHKLHRHDAADAVVRVLEQIIYRLASLRIHVFEQLSHKIRRHIAQEIRSVVRKQLLEQTLHLCAGKSFDKLLTQIVVHVAESLRSFWLIEYAENHRQFPVVQLREQLCQVHRVIHGQHVMDRPQPLLLEKGLEHIYSHSHTLLPAAKKPPCLCGHGGAGARKKSVLNSCENERTCKAVSLFSSSETSSGTAFHLRSPQLFIELPHIWGLNCTIFNF